MARKWECQNLLNCHLAISCSWIDYHTSSERGDSGVSADSKNFEIFHTNGYFQAYFWVALGSTKLHPQLGLSLSHFFSDIRLPYPHLKRIPRAFIWTQMLENIFSNKRARAWGNLYVGNPSYFLMLLKSGTGCEYPGEAGFSPINDWQSGEKWCTVTAGNRVVRLTNESDFTVLWNHRHGCQMATAKFLDCALRA